MKNILNILLCFTFFVAVLSGQSTEMWPDSVVYITPEDEVHLRDKQAKYLGKLGLDLGFEFKISKAFSLNVELFPDFLSHDVNRSLGIGYGVGARYYYQMKNRIKAGKQANNLSGKYVSLMLGQGYNIFSTPDTSFVIDGSFGFSLGVGVQQRYLEHEYFDYQLNLDYTSVNRGNENKPGFVTYTLRTKSAYGYVIGKRHEVDKEALCPVIKCYTNRKSGFKINRNNIFSLSRSISSDRPDVLWGLSLRPRIGHELKIMNSAFSVAQDFSMLLSFRNFDRIFNGNYEFEPTKFKLNYVSFRYGMALRYYYSMNKRILAGVQGNNLSGFYIYSEFQHERRASDFNSNDITNRGTVVLGFGRQTEITGRLYMDAQVGIGHSIYSDASNRGIALDIDFTVGYMF